MPYQKEESSQINNQTLHLKELEKQEQPYQKQVEKEITNIRAETNNIETKCKYKKKVKISLKKIKTKLTNLSLD